MQRRSAHDDREPFRGGGAVAHSGIPQGRSSSGKRAEDPHNRSGAETSVLRASSLLPEDLARGVSTSFAGLGGDGDAVRAEVEEILEALLVHGDLLEMMSSAADEWRASDFVLRPAPPTFVRRSDGSIVILGVAGDEFTPLTGEMA